MRHRFVTLSLALSLAVAIAGCGGAGGISTGTLSVGSTVHPDQYLVDSRGAATAIGDFAAIVNALPKPLTARALRAAATAMAEPLTRAEAVQGRLIAMRLEDQRLEAQRVRVHEANAAVIQAMDRMRTAAAAADAAGAKDAAADLQTAIAALRAIGEPAG